eukprot:COSAG02_NODE_29306_length_571_cov_10.023305_1_plen_75_part_01
MQFGCDEDSRSDPPIQQAPGISMQLVQAGGLSIARTRTYSRTRTPTSSQQQPAAAMAMAEDMSVAELKQALTKMR